MAKISIVTMDEAETVRSAAPGGEVERSLFFSSASDPLRLTAHRLTPGAATDIDANVSDVALFVWRGSVTANNVALEERASAIVEYGSALRVIAQDEGATILAFEASSRADASRVGGSVQLLPLDRVPEAANIGGNVSASGALHADGQALTNSVWMHENLYFLPGKEAGLHSHSEDELIFIHSGSIQLGNRTYGAGTAILIKANTKYRFVTGPDGLSFVNFSARAPTFTSGDGTIVQDEAKLWIDLAGAPRHISWSTN